MTFKILTSEKIRTMFYSYEMTYYPHAILGISLPGFLVWGEIE